MAEDGLQLDPVCWLDSEAGSHKVPALLRHILPEVQLGVADLLVLLEGDVATDHVEQEDTQAPHSEWVGFVPVAADPLWWCVHSGPVKVGEVLLLEECSGPEVNELELSSGEVHQQVLILDVPVHDALAVARQHRVHNLAEEIARQLLVQNPLLCDEVKQIFGVRRSLEDVDETVTALIKVNQLNHSLNVLHRAEKLQLQRNSLALKLGPLGNFGLRHMLDGNLSPVRESGAGVHGAEASLAEHLAHSVGALEGQPGLLVLVMVAVSVVEMAVAAPVAHCRLCLHYSHGVTYITQHTPVRTHLERCCWGHSPANNASPRLQIITKMLTRFCLHLVALKIAT